MNLDEAQKLAALWVSAQNDVATFIRAFIRDADQANDVLQQVAMKIVRKFDRYDPERPFTPWAIAVAKNEVLAHLRSERADRLVFDVSTVERVADVVEQRLQNDGPYGDALRHCIEQAEPRGKRALELHYSKGMKTAAIADEMSMTPGAVRMLLCRVREALRICIEARLASRGES
ncbi:MAG: sigma-70 family RNA polymerase sigma factor [Pirellulales bacterium]|nr:sigma-70 family RNA polymerase sigma factor [Pirellulales bacterium]